jgi:hypothetical protein
MHGAKLVWGRVRRRGSRHDKMKAIGDIVLQLIRMAKKEESNIVLQLGSWTGQWTKLPRDHYIRNLQWRCAVTKKRRRAPDASLIPCLTLQCNRRCTGRHVSDLPPKKQKKMLTTLSAPNRRQRHQTDMPAASRPITADSL